MRRRLAGAHLSGSAIPDCRRAGQGDSALKIYFRSEENRREYLEMEVHGSTNSAGLKAIFDDAADSPITGSIN